MTTLQRQFNDAAYHGHLETIKLLLKDSRVDPSDLDNYAIRNAARRGYLELISNY